MQAIVRRRVSTVEFLSAVEAFGRQPSEASNYPAPSASLSKRRRKESKAWYISRIIKIIGTDGETIRERLITLSSSKGSPIAVSSIASYDPYESQIDLDPVADIISAFKPGIDDMTRSKHAESYKHLISQGSTIDSSDSSQSSEYSSFSSISSSSSSSQKHLVPEVYDPSYLDDPELTAGRHRTVVCLPGFYSSISHYAGEDEIKRELNEHFRQMHPYLHPSITLTKIRNLKKLLLGVASECDVEVSSLAIAFALLEKLILGGHVVKANRRLCGACCLILAAKSCDYRDEELDLLLKSTCHRLRINKHDIIRTEFSVFATLSFSLHLSSFEYLPHFERIFADLNYCNYQEYLGEKMYSLWSRDA